jgi:DivIVA domain-containing protein
MLLTPAQVHNVVFGKPPIGKRGYNEDEVDRFLDVVEAELTRLLAENDDLRRQLEQPDKHHRGAPPDTGSADHSPEPPGPVMASPPPLVNQAAPPGDHSVHTTKVLDLAQQMADQLTSAVQAEADQILSQARAHADQLLSAAKTKADSLMQEARTQADTLLAHARTTAEAREQQARDNAAALELQATQQRSQAVAETIAVLRQQKKTLEYTIDRLRTLEQEYRTRLKTYFLEQLHELDGDETGPPTAPIPNPPSLAAVGPNTHAE